MKNLCLLAFILGIMNATAQTQVKIPVIDPNEPNPFARIGVYEPVLGFTGKNDLYKENAVLELYGFGYDPKTGKIVYIKPDSISDQIIAENDTVRVRPTETHRWLSTDPVMKATESPYAAFSNSPIYLIDPDGRDTLVMHRSEVTQTVEGSTSEHRAEIFVVTFSMIQNGVETKIPGEMMMMGNANYVKLKKPIYNLKWQKMATASRYFREDAKTINVEGAVFIHPGQWATNLKGCYTMCETEDFKIDKDGDAVFSNTTDAINSVYDTYKAYEPTLTGSKFILKTNSVAEDNGYLEPKKIDQIDTQQPEREIQGEIKPVED